MRLYLVIIIGFLLVGCGNNKNVDNPNITGSRQFETSDPEFDTLKQDYTTEANGQSVSSNLSNIPINFGDLDSIPGLSLKYQELSHGDEEDCDHHVDEQDNSYHFVSVKETSFATTVGVCIEYSNGTTEILIRESSWNTFSNTQREILIFHELGHCHLDRDHKNDEHKSFAVSVMKSLLIDQFDYQNYYNEYMIELFTTDDVPLRDAVDVDFP